MTATHARRAGSPVQHLLDRAPGPVRTACGQDARLMARYSPSDLPSGERHTRTCERCRSAAR